MEKYGFYLPDIKMTRWQFLRYAQRVLLSLFCRKGFARFGIMEFYPPEIKRITVG